MTKQNWQELKETITELRDSDGTLSQQEVCKFLVRYMEVLENNVNDFPPMTEEEHQKCREIVEKYRPKNTLDDLWKKIDEWKEIP